MVVMVYEPSWFQRPCRRRPGESFSLSLVVRWGWVLGRVGNFFGACRTHASWNSPKDVGLPYMLDPRMPSDQLFFVFESDHRFYEADCIPPKVWLKYCGQEFASGTAARRERQEEERPMSLDTVQEEGEEGSWQAQTRARSTLSAAGQGLQPGSSSDPPPPQPTRHRQAEPLAGREKTFTPFFGAWEYGGRVLGKDLEPVDELACLVRLHTQAQRLGRGDLVWYSWNAAKSKRQSHPSHGSQMIGLTKTGAAALAAFFQRSMPCHFDIGLLHALLDQELALGACYVYPAIGHYTEHESGCDPALGIRPAHWGETWIMEGVRPPKGKDRYLMGFCKKGLEWGPKVDFDGYEYVWKTLAPPDHWWEWDHTLQHMLRARNWVNEHFTEWWGPQKGKGKGNKGKGDGKNKGRPSRRPSEYDVLRENPSSHTDPSGAWSPISRMAAELVVDETNVVWDAPHSARHWNTRRSQLALYKHRVFSVGRACVWGGKHKLCFFGQSVLEHIFRSLHMCWMLPVRTCHIQGPRHEASFLQKTFFLWRSVRRAATAWILC